MVPTGPRPVTPPLAQTRQFEPLTFVDLRRSMAETTAGTNLAATSELLTALRNRAGLPPTPRTPPPNPHRTRGTVSTPPPAISSLGGFPTPTAGACGFVRDRPASETLLNSSHSKCGQMN